MLGEGVRDLDPRIGRIYVCGDLSCGSTGDGGVEGGRHVCPLDGVNDNIIGHVVVIASVVQKGIVGDKTEIRDVVFCQLILGDIEDLSQVHGFADGEEAAERAGGSYVVLEGVDEQSPVGPSCRLSENSGDKAIS